MWVSWLLLCAHVGLAQTLSNPIFTPPSGTATPVVVTMTNLDPNAITYFTLDGTLPGSNSTRYTGPVTITDYTVIRARAFADGQPPSAAVSAYYYAVSVEPGNSYMRIVTDDASATPLVTVQLTSAASVLSFAVEERLPALLQATNISNGGVWNPDRGTVRWGPFGNTPALSLSYRVTGLPGTYPVDGSESVDGQWTFALAPTLVTIALSLPSFGPPPSPPPQVSMPVFTPPSGAALPTDASLSCATPNAVIHYTLDGSLPTALSAIYTNSLHFDSAAIVRARAFRDDWTPSAASVAYYGPVLPPPDLQVTRAVDTNAAPGPLVSLTASAGADAHCFVVEEWLPAGLSAANITAGGVFIPGSAVVRWGPFFTAGTQTLAYQAVGLPGAYPVRATWSVDGVSSGEVQGTNLVLAPPVVTNVVPAAPSQEPPPVLAPALGGALPVTVTISCSDTQAELHYTLDGSAPTVASPLYTNALVFAQPTTVRARALRLGSVPSAEAVGYYGLSLPAPDLQVSRAIITNSPLAPVVTLTATPGSGLPTATCFAVEEWLPAGLAAVQVSAGGVFIASNAVVRWGPFFGPAPVALSYQAVGLPGTYPLRATWSVNGISNGESQGTNVVIATAISDLGPLPTAPAQAPAPALSPVNGAALPITVAISCSDPQAQIRYTLDGSSPTNGSALYTSPLTLASPGTLRARSFRTGYLPSAAVVGYYTPASTNSLALVRSVADNRTYLPEVTITATPQNIQCYAVMETVAPGLTPYQVGQNGIWDSINRVLKWGPYTDSQVRKLTYKVTGPSTSYPLAGQGSFDGYPAASTGWTQLQVDQTTVIYSGNTNDGFGGAIGNGSLVLSDDGTNLYGTLITSGPMDNALVLYIASGAGGFTSTADFHDAAEPLRTAISGYTSTQNNGGSGQSVLTFRSGFAPNYAIALQPGNGVNFGGLWALANGGDNSLQFVTNVNLAPVGTDSAGTYRFSLDVAQFGLSPGAGQSFGLFGTFIADTGFRSTEAVAGDLTGIQGWNPFKQTAFSTYTMVPAIFPLIVAPPADAMVTLGQSAQFRSTAIGALPLTYQWQFNGTNLTDNPRISGSQSGTLTITGAQLSDMGTYLLVVTNAFGSAMSAGSVLAVGQAPNILVQPLSQTILAGSNLFLSVTAAGVAPLAYQWWFNGAALADAPRISGSHSNSLTTANLQASDAGNYQVIVTDAYGAVTSAVAVLTVRLPETGGAFMAAADSVVRRSGHTATSLADGRVLITGGEAPGPVVVASAEIYDPTTGSFSLTGSMGTPRQLHAAVRLRDGRVLVLGGTGLWSAEIYDPATGTFSPTGNMAPIAPGDGQQATLLASGRVLVTGGYNGGPSPVAQLFDPATGAFTSTGSMSVGRYNHQAALLQDGRVLVVGGFGGLSSAENYDPATGLFTATGSMSVARDSFTATLLANGTVLVTGGLGLSSAEHYDPATGAFTPAGGMSSQHYQHAATLMPGGTVLITGYPGGYGNANAELYLPTLGGFGMPGQMHSDRTLHTATLLQDGTVLIVGGNPNAGNELFVPTFDNPLPNRTAPVITWEPPGDIVYGTALGSAQLNAIADVPGTFNYAPAAGTVLSAGAGQVLSVTFTPSDLLKYITVSASVTINVSKRPMTVTADSASRLYGEPNPSVAVSIVGARPGDDFLTNTFSPATPASPAGDYAIVPSLVDIEGKLGNYEVTYVNGTLTVQPPPNTVAGYGPANPVVLFGISDELFQAGQTFHPTASGQLGKISVLLSGPQGDLATSIFVDFRTSQSGVPTATVLGTATISGSLLTSTPALLSADFTSLNLPISAGTEYAFTLRVGNGTGGAYISGDDANGYAAGAAYVSSDSGATWNPPGIPNDYDIAFQVSLAGAATLAPVVTTQPQSQTVSAGASVSLTVVASGTGPLSFQWSHDGSPIAGATTATLSLNAVQTGAAGDYFVTISNAAGSVTSSLATLLVMDPANPPGNNGFLATGSMPTRRYQHTATLLPSGKVLIAGGHNSDRTLSEAELYDPSTGTFAATGPMTLVRDAHTATLLPNGEVLITGGEGDLRTLAELYNPMTGAFTAAGNMNSVRYYHTATLLLNGKVLIVGGGGAAGTSLASAELYDPATGAFKTTGSLSTARIHHAATLLANGQVLVTGGSNPATGDADASAEIYDPATGTFSSTGSMSWGHAWHTATALADGRVMVAGGMISGFSVGAIAELYDPATGTFSSTGSLNTPRLAHTATRLPDGSVLLTGGGNPYTASAELYLPGSNSFSKLASSMNTARAYHTATLLQNGAVLIAGGYNGTYLASAELWQPSPLVVTTTADAVAHGGLTSLRQAIVYANTLSGSKTIVFNIPTTDPNYSPVSGVYTIAPTSALPVITEPVVIDGTTQAGFDPGARRPVIELNGSNAGVAVGLNISAGNSTVRGLVVNRFSDVGIFLQAGGTNHLEGNFIGTDATGRLALGNGLSGVGISSGSASNVIGGTTAASRNLISGNRQGVLIFGGSNNVVEGNYIGVDASGTAPIANTNWGVDIELSGSGNVIGGTGAGVGNVIAFNGSTGVRVASGVGNTVRGNSIFSNLGLGISLGVGANNQQSYPVWARVRQTNGSISIVGGLFSSPNATFAIDFYGNTQADPSGYGQGQVYLGSRTVTSDGAGNAPFSLILPLPSGGLQFLTATATDALGNTSAFSQATPSVIDVPPSIAPVANQVTTAGQPITVNFTLSDSQLDPGILAVVGHSANTAVVPEGNVILGGGGGARTVTLTPEPNQTGVTTITLIAYDDLLSASTTFTLTVMLRVDSLQPASVLGGGSGFTLTVNGAGFASGAVVFWNGQPRSTTWVSGSQISAVISAADIALGNQNINTATITVLNPDGAISNPQAFTIVCANVGGAQSQIAPAGQTATVSTAPTAQGQAGVTASLDNSSGSQPVSVTAATYNTNPASGAIFDAGSSYLDLKVSGATASSSLTSHFYYPATVTGNAEASLTLLYYTGTGWARVLSSGGAVPVKDTTDNLEGTVSGGRLTVIFDNTSTPLITQLTGTAFALAVDTTPPVIACPANMVVGNDPGQCSAVVSYSVTATDNSGTVSVTCTPPSGSVFPPSATTVTCTATDLAGNVATRSFTVTVKDTEKPTVSCRAGTTASANANCQVAVPNVLGGVTVSDNCTPANAITLVQSPAAGAMVGLGTTIITVTATDASGNSSSCTTTLTVADTTAPVVMLKGVNPMTVECHSAFTDPGATASDTCAGDLSSRITVGGAVDANSPGTYTLTYSVTDPSHNTSTATRTVNVVDTTAPAISVLQPNPMTMYYGATFVEPGATATDTCAGTISVYYDMVNGVNPATLGSAVGTYTVKYYAKDPAGNISGAQRIVNVLYKPAGISCNGNPGHTILQPINADGSSSFKQGSTVPCKFQVFDANCNSVGTPGLVASFVLLATSSGAPSVNETIISTTPDTAFHWDPSGQHWIFNLSTKNLPKNTTFHYQINLNDGSNIQFSFGLR